MNIKLEMNMKMIKKNNRKNQSEKHRKEEREILNILNEDERGKNRWG